jgi:tRNA (guanine-N(7)-)-methyltransferase subunit TRM82
MILSADKFGDVYSLPLIQVQDQEIRSSTLTADKPWKPSANELTIHSQRNRIALENQKRHHNTAPKIQLPTFEHTLLLGHVSLLIDLKLVTLEGKTYIITADRDEHIRVSRGISQAHIIEGFCLGHREFVSRLCVPKTRPEVLLSGGGDDELFLWSWRTSDLLCKSNLRLRVGKIIENGENGEKERKITVSGIYDIRHEGVDMILVTIEAYISLFLPCPKKFELTMTSIPGILVFRLYESTLTYMQTLRLPGNVLSLVTSSSRVIISVDAVHAPGSTAELSTTDKPASSFHTYNFNGDVLEQDTAHKIAGVEHHEVVAVDSVENKRMATLLYSIEILRKRVGDYDGAEVEEA